MLMNIQDKLYIKIRQFAEANGKKDEVEIEINRLLELGFNVDRFGMSPFTKKITPIIEPEKIEEKVKEEPKELQKELSKEESKENTQVESNVNQEVATEEPKPKRKRRTLKVIHND